MFGSVDRVRNSDKMRKFKDQNRINEQRFQKQKGKKAKRQDKRTWSEE